MMWIVILLCLCLVNCQEKNQTEDELVFVQVLFRHGDRTIRKTYINDPYKDKKYWPEGFGHLTNIGKKREYDLGKFLQRRYGDFLGAYSPDKVSIVSSNNDRTINSANLVLAALFPPEKNQIWNENLLWQPIAVHSLPKEVDNLIRAQEACPRYIQALEQYEESEEIKGLKEENRELFNYVEQNAGQPVRTLEELKDIHETLVIEYERFNKTLPEWTRKIFVPGGDLEKLSLRWFKFITGTTELKRLKSGFLIKDILDRFKSKTLSELPDNLIQIYSAHDSTLASFLHSLDVFDSKIPPYSSCVMFELHRTGDGYHVELLYRNSESDELEPIEFPGCGSKCGLDQLFDIYSNILPGDVQTECKKVE